MNPKKCHEIFKRLKKAIKNPKTELGHTTPYELLVAVILSAQTTDKGVNKATPKLFALANTPEKMVALGETKLKKYIKTIGLYNNKAKSIINASKMLVEKFNSEVPQTREALELLPGVGRKSANVLLNVAFGQPTIGVDTHVFRVSNRTHIAPGKNVLAVEEKLMKIIPKEFILDAHHFLVLHGRYTCTAKKPHCPECPINDLCEYDRKTKGEDCLSRRSAAKAEGLRNT